MKQKKLILIKLIGIGNDESDEYGEMMLKIIVKKVIIKCINIIVMIVLNMKVKIMVLNIICISVIVRLVSRRGGSLNWIWTPQSSSRRK